jgi:hypothetical protein
VHVAITSLAAAEPDPPDWGAPAPDARLTGRAWRPACTTCCSI